MLIFPMSAWLMIILAVVMGIGMAGVGMSVMHDAVHGSFSGKVFTLVLANCSLAVSLLSLAANQFTFTPIVFNFRCISFRFVLCTTSSNSPHHP
jgi:hypothetical protein